MTGRAVFEEDLRVVGKLFRLVWRVNNGTERAAASGGEATRESKANDANRRRQKKDRSMKIHTMALNSFPPTDLAMALLRALYLWSKRNYHRALLRRELRRIGRTLAKEEGARGQKLKR